MKKLLILISLFVLITNFAFSQTDKGRFLIGAGSKLEFNNIETDFGGSENISSSELTFAPRIGYFVIDNLNIGIMLPITYQSQEYDEEDRSVLSLAIAPYVQYYFLEDNFKPFIYGSLGVGTSSIESSTFYGNNGADANMFLYELGAGCSYFINRYVAIEAALGYHNETYDYDENVDETTMSGIRFEIGFSVLL